MEDDDDDLPLVCINYLLTLSGGSGVEDGHIVLVRSNQPMKVFTGI